MNLVERRRGLLAKLIVNEVNNSDYYDNLVATVTSSASKYPCQTTKTVETGNNVTIKGTVIIKCVSIVDSELSNAFSLKTTRYGNWAVLIYEKDFEVGEIRTIEIDQTVTVKNETITYNTWLNAVATNGTFNYTINDMTISVN